MDDITKAGGSDGQPADVNGRMYRWSQSTQAWLPMKPQPFEVANAFDATHTTWTWMPAAGTWVNLDKIGPATDSGPDVHGPVILRVSLEAQRGPVRRG